MKRTPLGAVSYTHLARQQDWFRVHVAAARELGKPLIVHTRDAREDTLRILREEGAAEVGGVLHCFTEDWDMAERALELGFHISFSGIVTFKNAKPIQEVARRLPAERLLVETDSPYLAPAPHRGKPNHPAVSYTHLLQHPREPDQWQTDQTGGIVAFQAVE